MINELKEYIEYVEESKVLYDLSADSCLEMIKEKIIELEAKYND